MAKEEEVKEKSSKLWVMVILVVVVLMGLVFKVLDRNPVANVKPLTTEYQF